MQVKKGNGKAYLDRIGSDRIGWVGGLEGRLVKGTGTGHGMAWHGMNIGV